MDADKFGGVTRIAARVLVIVVFLLLVIILLGGVIGTRFVYGTVNYVIYNLAARSGLSIFLVDAVVIVATIPFFIAVGMYTRNVLGLLNMAWGGPLAFYRNKYGIIIVAYVACYFFAMYLASKDALAFKYCAKTPEGIKVSDSEGKDPVYGVQFAPCTFDQKMDVRFESGDLQAPKEVMVSDVSTYSWFNGATSKPLVWYDVLPSGDYKFFDRQGSDPNTGAVLKPGTPEFVQQLRQRTAIKDAAARQQKAEQEAQEARAKDAADLQVLVDQAQKEFEAENYRGTKEDCDQVLRRGRSEPCVTLKEHASVKLAQQLVSEGQTQLERGQFNEALWNAENALKLDPANPNAAKLKQFALQMKPHDVN